MQNSENKPNFQTGDIVNNGYVDRRIKGVFQRGSGGWWVQYSDIDGGGIDSCEQVTLVSRPLPKPTYKIIEHLDADALSTAVNKAILEGFKPIGGVSMSEHRHYMQAMLKA